LDSGYTDGTFFFALEYCDGSNVFDLMQQRGGKLPVREALSITLQILEGLEYAHRQGQGLLHCQLKPSNILLAGGLSTVTGNAAIAKIADYGLAKAFDRAGLGGLSMSGSTANLPVFMPRQQAVNFNYASAEVDVWASAACLYYMLTGTYPRNFSHGKDPYLVLLQTEPVSIRDRAPEIPAALAQLIDRALVDNPEITFKSATALKQALKQVAM
jgi:eukaryotic-like serine/threonine-protein kinase